MVNVMALYVERVFTMRNREEQLISVRLGQVLTSGRDVRG
jgi:hypothetical protein